MTRLQCKWEYCQLVFTERAEFVQNQHEMSITNVFLFQGMCHIFHLYLVMIFFFFCQMRKPFFTAEYLDKCLSQKYPESQKNV